MSMNVLSLFSGIGGLELGLERAGMRVVAQCESDPYCRAVLAMHWPAVPCWEDVRTLDPATLGPVDLVCGGFPCQDISSAGKGAGIDGDRSGLWKEMHRVIDAVRPRWIVAENVPALRTRGADRVLGDLEGIGYTCWPLVVGADDIGAPHRRKRVFIVADLNGVGREGDRGGGILDGERSAPGHDADGCGAERVADAGGGHVRGRRDAGELGSPHRRDQGEGDQRQRGGPVDDDRVGAFPPRPRDFAGWRLVLGVRPDLAPALPVEPSVCGLADGVPPRLVRRARKQALRAYGNAVVPEVAEMIGRAILAVEGGEG